MTSPKFARAILYYLMITLFNVKVAPEAIAYVNQVLASTFLNEGEWVDKFETELSKLGLVNPATLNSCTSALHLSLECAGVRGGEVIIPAQTFIATGTAVLQAGATPVFADIDLSTGNTSVEHIQEKITPRTKAVIPVHWGGIPADIDPIVDRCRRHNITVIEDAAHALGATYKGRAIGSISDYTCFSFQAIKFLTTGDGGAISTPCQDRYEEIRRRKWFGYDRRTIKRLPEGDRENLIDTLGYKYHMNNIEGALGYGNILNIKERLAKRRANAARYLKELTIDGVTLLTPQYECEPSYWVFTMMVENRRAFIEKLKAAGIASSVLDRRIDKNPIFTMDKLPNQEKFDSLQTSIPVHDDMTEEDVDHVISTIKSGW